VQTEQRRSSVWETVGNDLRTAIKRFDRDPGAPRRLNASAIFPDPDRCRDLRRATQPAGSDLKVERVAR
jgi:hypothetical protein